MAKMRFKKIKMKEFKIFKDNEIVFNDRINFIAGSNASGKTTLFNMLKRGLVHENENYEVEIEGCLSTDNLDNIFIDSHILENISKLSSSKTNLFFEVKEFSELYENKINKIFGKVKDKNISGKWIVKDKSIFFRNKQGEAGFDVFSAGKRHLLAMAEILTIREMKQVSDPLVLDSVFARLDKEHAKALFKTLKELNQQIIIFMTNAEMQNIKQKPHFEFPQKDIQATSPADRAV